MDNNIVKIISIKIKKYCYENNISLNEFSLRCGLTYSTVYHIVKCDTKNITQSTICSISKGMNLKLNEFYNDKVFEIIDNNYL